MKIHKVEIDNKEVFISQRGESFKVIKPFKNSDGTINWFNVLTGGSWGNLIMVGIVILILIGLLNEYSSNLNLLLDCFRVPGRLQICMEVFGNQSSTLIIP